MSYIFGVTNLREVHLCFGLEILMYLRPGFVKVVPQFLREKRITKYERQARSTIPKVQRSTLSLRDTPMTLRRIRSTHDEPSREIYPWVCQGWLTSILAGVLGNCWWRIEKLASQKMCMLCQQRIAWHTYSRRWGSSFKGSYLKWPQISEWFLVCADHKGWRAFLHG